MPLLKAVVATGTPVILFIINAGPVDLSWAKSNVAAMVSAGYGGEYGGQGIADVLTGQYNPGAALSYSLYTERHATATPYDLMVAICIKIDEFQIKNVGLCVLK